jgi:hypothetical protein
MARSSRDSGRAGVSVRCAGTRLRPAGFGVGLGVDWWVGFGLEAFLCIIVGPFGAVLRMPEGREKVQSICGKLLKNKGLLVDLVACWEFGMKVTTEILTLRSE